MEKKRYNLGLPVEMFSQIEEIAEEEQSTVLAMIQRFIKLGLMLHTIVKSGGKIYVKEGKKTREILIV